LSTTVTLTLFWVMLMLMQGATKPVGSNVKLKFILASLGEGEDDRISRKEADNSWICKVLLILGYLETKKSIFF
jgi:hypothetical protein